MLLLAKLMSGADCPLLFVGATLQQDRIWYSWESRSGYASLVSDWFELAEQLDAQGTALARKDNIVD
jgi:hypothetical protein